MAAPPANPNTSVTAVVTFTVSDLLAGGVITLNRTIPSVLLKTLNFQYGGFVNLPGNSSFQFTPSPTGSIFSMFFVRNAGTPAGTANVLCQFQTPSAANVNSMTLEVGAMLLYMTPALSSIAVSGVNPGVNSIQITTPVGSNTANIEVYAAT